MLSILNKIVKNNNPIIKKELKMRSKQILVLVALLAVALFTGSDAYSQVRWYDSPNGVAMSATTPGDTVTATLKFILDATNGTLTNGDFIEIDLSSFQVNATAAVTAANYAFSSDNSTSNTSMSMVAGSDFGVTKSGNLVTITLATENSLVPGDSVTVVISNILTYKGDGGTTTDYSFIVRTSKQPLV